MPSVTQSLDTGYQADPQSIGRARSDLARFAACAGASTEQIDNVRLAVSEAATNSVLHGYRGAPGEVRIAAGVSEGELWIVITDSGSGMQVGADRPGLGLGLGLIARITDHLMIVPRPEGGTELRMRFGLETRAPTATAGGIGAVSNASMAAVALPSQS